MSITPLNADANNGAVRSNVLAPAWTHPAALSVVGLCLLWAYWPTLATLADRWSHDPQYSHGFLVPLFATVVLWHRRDLMPKALTPNWWGMALLLVGVVLHVYGGLFYYPWFEQISLLPAVAGLSLLVGGWATLKWNWPAVAFLGFMLPLPFTLDMALAVPLRSVATQCSTYGLQTLGYPALAEGNIIYIDEVKLGVVEACSGLGMLMTFFALSTAVAIVIDRRWADKAAIVASAVPIAVIANVFRITATGVAYCSIGPQAGPLLHDWAGWLMMPLALGLLWLELRFLSRLLLDEPAPAPLPIGFAGQHAELPHTNKVLAAPQAGADQESHPSPTAANR